MYRQSVVNKLFTLNLLFSLFPSRKKPDHVKHHLRRLRIVLDGLHHCRKTLGFHGARIIGPASDIETLRVGLGCRKFAQIFPQTWTGLDLPIARPSCARVMPRASMRSVIAARHLLYILC